MCSKLTACFSPCLPAVRRISFLFHAPWKYKKVLDAIAVKHKIPLIDAAVRAKSAHIAGTFGCLGFDTFGLFKLVGGIANGRPNQEDLDSALRFYEALTVSS